MGSRVNLRVGYLLGAVLIPSPSFIESGVCVAKGDPLGVVGGLGSGKAVTPYLLWVSYQGGLPGGRDVNHETHMMGRSSEQVTSPKLSPGLLATWALSALWE